MSSDDGSDKELKSSISIIKLPNYSDCHNDCNDLSSICLSVAAKYWWYLPTGASLTLASLQRPKNPSSRVALLPGKFLRVRKDFARMIKMII